MKKITVSMIVFMLLLSIAAFAEETKKEEMPVNGPMPGMGKMCSGMMGMTQMVATDEGGVIVLAGNKLMKYDADLNLAKEVEVKMPPPPMMDKQCPLRGQRAGMESSRANEKTA